jgi:hypothetical protein
MIPAVYNWGGFYIGLNGGGGSSHNCWNLAVNAARNPVFPIYRILLDPERKSPAYGAYPVPKEGR